MIIPTPIRFSPWAIATSQFTFRSPASGASHFCVIKPGDSVTSLLIKPIHLTEHLKMFHGLFRNHAGMEEGFPVDHPVSSFPNPLGYHSEKLHIFSLQGLHHVIGTITEVYVYKIILKDNFPLEYKNFLICHRLLII